MPHGKVGGEKMHSSKTSTQRPITAHFWGSVESGSMVEGSMCDWVREWLGRAGYSQPWGYRGHQLPIQEKGYNNIDIYGFLLEHLRLLDHPRGTHQSINLYIWGFH